MGIRSPIRSVRVRLYVDVQARRRRFIWRRAVPDDFCGEGDAWQRRCRDPVQILIRDDHRHGSIKGRSIQALGFGEHFQLILARMQIADPNFAVVSRIATRQPSVGATVAGSSVAWLRLADLKLNATPAKG
jgi:hypothetical protein